MPETKNYNSSRKKQILGPEGRFKRPTITGLTACTNKQQAASARLPRVKNKRSVSSAEPCKGYLTRGICLPGTPEYYKRQFMMSRSDTSTSGLAGDDECLHHSKVERIQPVSSKITMEDKPLPTRPYQAPPLRRRTEFDRIVAEYRADLNTNILPPSQTPKLPLIHYHQPNNQSIIAAMAEGNQKMRTKGSQEVRQQWNPHVIQQWNKHLRQQWNQHVRQQWNKRVMEERNQQVGQEGNQQVGQEGNQQVGQEGNQQVGQEWNQEMTQERKQVRQEGNQQMGQVGNQQVKQTVNQHMMQEREHHARQEGYQHVRQQWNQQVRMNGNQRARREENQQVRQEGNQQVRQERNQSLRQEQNQQVRQKGNQQMNHDGNKRTIHQPLQKSVPLLLQRRVKQNFNLEYLKTHLRNLDEQIYKIKH